MQIYPNLLEQPRLGKSILAEKQLVHLPRYLMAVINYFHKVEIRIISSVLNYHHQLRLYL